MQLQSISSLRLPRAQPTVRSSLARKTLVVRATGVINPDIKKDDPKVVDEVVASDMEKPMTAYCRCWRSKTFPKCDGAF
jgi:CDGSH-type Zn-finger protein